MLIEPLASGDLFHYLDTKPEDRPGRYDALPWRPRVLDHTSWPPDYKAVYAWRMDRLLQFRQGPFVPDFNDNGTPHPYAGKRWSLVGALEYYKTHRIEFIMHWLDTYNPKKTSNKWVPFILFKRQAEYIQFLEELERDQIGGLVEKTRDVGLTWLSVAYSVHAWRFVDGAAIGWGSRGQVQVDRIGDPSSIFEKMRLMIRRMPKVFLPTGFIDNRDMNSMKITNPDNGAVITGEVGDNIGRGGRTSIYFKDESAHYEHADAIENALSENTNVQVDISSVNGLGNAFQRRREAGIEWFPGAEIAKGKTRVFIVDWRDHPEKTQEWYDTKKIHAMEEGREAGFAQEVDRDYAGAVSGRIIDLAWIKAAIDADKSDALIKWRDTEGKPVDFTSGQRLASLDVADSDKDSVGDRNALARRKGIVLEECDEWGERDPGVTTRKTIELLAPYPGIECQYDSVGIGAAVRSEYNRLTDIDPVTKKPILSPNTIKMIGWSAGASVIDPLYRVNPNDDQSQLNKDFFANLKAQGWWALKLRFWRTFRAVTEGVRYDPADLIVLRGTLKRLRQIEKELSQPVFTKHSGNLKTMVDKKPDGTRSPNLADAIMMCYFPVPDGSSFALIGTQSVG